MERMAELHGIFKNCLICKVLTLFSLTEVLNPDISLICQNCDKLMENLSVVFLIVE